ncbi:MAG: acylphosphatase [Bacteroidota bacterium]|nr:acylphosphatase [Bacteroidota bacterium]
MKTMHCRISGLVQGVGFRYFVLQRARELGVRGYVRNEYTGDVEVRAQGEPGQLEDFMRALRVGPRSAHVRDVRIDWEEEDEMYNSFEIRV